MTKPFIFTIVLLSMLACNANESNEQSNHTQQLTADDKIEITEVAATFDNSLDKETLAPFLGTFTLEGTLEIAGKKYQRSKELEGVFYYMLNTFARGKRHCVTNHIITGTADSAAMESYLSVIDRNTLQRAGSAIQHDELRKVDGRWKINYRRIDIDSSFFQNQ